LRITDHADEEAEADTLTFDEIFFSVRQDLTGLTPLGQAFTVDKEWLNKQANTVDG
jgi:hypothetical protein